MDIAVALVQAYLQVNGYFTVAEYPLLEARRHGHTRTITDLDILAVRFPMASPSVGSRKREVLGSLAPEPDPALGLTPGTADMIVGEVKQGAAHFNPAARDPLTLQAALIRFGCCAPDDAPDVAQDLLRHGRATTAAGHVVRMIAFGSTGDDEPRRHQVITLSAIIDFLSAHVHEQWDELGQARLTHPVLALLALMEKAERGRNA